ncbi:BnaA07g01650D [Brassica napus]|uniref:BnaA07g01650D protein n=1 Tax=Brassica napus TaxID=3708 RepID=A0A078IH54_BRANA|nr:BnaA07g01650D [Brassica napus]
MIKRILYHGRIENLIKQMVRKPKKDMSKSSTRTRALTNLSSGYDNSGTIGDEREVNVDSFGVGSWRVKKRVGPSTKRVRSNWVSRIGEMDHGDELEGGYRDFSREDSESPIKDDGNREFELSEPSNMEGIGGGGREGVKIWLQELGLGRYWPMFEIHEVDEEVLPLLTLEDLKDMGINAVGSRRKMFCAIQKLGREFS